MPPGGSPFPGVFHFRLRMRPPSTTVQRHPDLVAFNKPYGVVCQFSRHESHPSLADFIPVPGIYPAGRLDTDSEGLLILTSDGALQHRISSPKHKLPKRYLVQVEGMADDAAIGALRNGVELADGRTLPCRCEAVPEPLDLWPRNPPIRVRRDKPTSWLAIELMEGRNRQVRRMTAHVGYPTLRLIRLGIGALRLESLRPGQWRPARREELGIPAATGPTPARRARR